MMGDATTILILSLSKDSFLEGLMLRQAQHEAFFVCGFLNV